MSNQGYWRRRFRRRCRNFMEYPGGKGGSGVYQKIISLMPPHKVYIECFLGNGSILRYKKPAERNIGVELDPRVIKEFWSEPLHKDFTILNECAVRYLNEAGNYSWYDTDVLIYCDPPYLQSVRRSQRQIYRYELMKTTEHIRLLCSLKKLNCNVMISGYDSDVYDKLLFDWRKVSFTGVSRGGATTEVVWMNFPEPAELHDYQFLGDDHRQRLDIKRKKQRWLNRLSKMKPQERYAFLSAFDDYKSQLTTAETPTRSGTRSNDGGFSVARQTAETPSSAGRITVTRS